MDFDEEFPEKSPVGRFQCKPEMNMKICAVYHQESQEKLFQYLPQSQIIRLAKLDPIYCDSVRNLTRTRTFFQCIKISYIAHVDQQVLEPLFMFIKKNYNMIRAADSLESNYEFATNVNYDRYSLPVIECLDFIKKFLMLVLDVSDNLWQYILEQMRKLLIFCGRMSQFDHQFQEYSFHRPSDSDGPLYHRFHLTLQIWWTYIEMTYMTSKFKTTNGFSFSHYSLLPFDDCGSSPKELFLSGVRIFLYDLLAFGLIRFQNCDSSEDQDSSPLTNTPFLCSCFLEIFIMLKILICQDSEHENNLEEFHLLLFDVIAHFDPGNQEKISLVKKHEIQMEHFKSIAIEGLFAQDFNRYSLWFWSNLVPLLKISIEDYNCDNDQNRLNIPGNILKIYRNLFRELEKRQKDSMIAVHHLLITAIRYIKFLSEPPIELIILFLDYYLKRLNQRFNIRASINLLEMVDFNVKNGQRWALNVIEIIGENNRQITYNDSFKIFLSFIHDQLKRLFELSATNKIQSERIVSINYQKIISKIIVTLQPNLIRSLQPAGFYRMGLFHLTLIRSIPIEHYSTFSDRLLNPIKELIREKKSLDFIEMIIKFLCSIFHIIDDEKQHHWKMEENFKISRILSKFIGNIIDERTVTFINPRKEFVSAILCYFNEIGILLQEMNQKTKLPLLMNYFEDLLSKIDLISLFKRLHSIGTHQSDRLKILEIFNEFLNVINRTILVDVNKKYISSSSPSSSSSTELNYTLPFDQQTPKNIINGVQPIIDSFIPIIKLETIDNNDEIVASLAFNVTLINHILGQRLNNEKLRNNLDIVEIFLSVDSPQNSHNPYCQEYFQLNYLYLLFEDSMIVDQMAKKFISIWCKLLIALPFEEDDENDDNDQRKKLISISRNIYRRFVIDTAGQQPVGSSTDPLIQSLSDNNETKIFEMFIKHLAGQSNVNLIDQYFRLMITTAQQMVQHRKWLHGKDVKLLSKLYRYISKLVAYLSRQLFVVGKSDCLMVFILENILIAPSNVLSLRALWPTLFKVSLPMILAGLSKLDQHCNDPYIERKFRQLILSYLPHLVQYLNFESIKITLSAWDNGYQYWKIQMHRVIERVYLVQRDIVLTKEMFEYLDQFCRIESTRDDLIRLTIAIFQININDFNLNERDFRTQLFQTIMAGAMSHLKDNDAIECQEFIDKTMGSFLKRWAQYRPAKMFEVVKRLFPINVHRTNPILVHKFCSRINQVADHLEKISCGGNQFIVRKLLKDFVSYYEKS